MASDIHSFSVFEYLYRDGGNYKAWGDVLLEGCLSEADVSTLRERFESREHFIAEQIGIPTLYAVLWSDCGSTPSSELDHVWHEFNAIRPATDEDLSRLTLWGTAASLLVAVERIRSWDLTLSANWEL